MKAPGIQILDIVNDSYLQNTLGDRVNHSSSPRIALEVPVTADTESKIFNVFKFSGTIVVLNQWARITEVTDLTNCTNVQATAYDGTNSEDLTADGIVLSGMPVGTFFSKTLDISQVYTLLDASAVEVYEPGGPKVGSPFLLNAKNGVDNFIRFHVTTNTTLDFKMYVSFEYRLLNGSTLELAA